MFQPKHSVIASHYPYMKLSNKRTLHSRDIKAGQVIRFGYDGKDRMVFVLNPNYENFLHALALDTVSRSALKTEILNKWNVLRDPQIFYLNAIRLQSENYPKSYKAYRTFNTSNMINVRLLTYSFSDTRL